MQIKLLLSKNLGISKSLGELEFWNGIFLGEKTQFKLNLPSFKLSLASVGPFGASLIWAGKTFTTQFSLLWEYQWYMYWYFPFDLIYSYLNSNLALFWFSFDTYNRSFLLDASFHNLTIHRKDIQFSSLFYLLILFWKIEIKWKYLFRNNTSDPPEVKLLEHVIQELTLVFHYKHYLVMQVSINALSIYRTGSFTSRF